MALHQLFTLAFALHLEPLATLDYVTVPCDPEQSHESLPEAESLRVGANTRLEPIFTRHSPHSVETISFLLQLSNALEGSAPWAELISLLEQADDDPSFTNLRNFFDARYDRDGKLVGAEAHLESSRSLKARSSLTRMGSRAKRNRQATETRKLSFAQSIGGASALKLGWLKKATDSQPGSSHIDTSEDEATPHSHPRAPLTAPEIRVPRSHCAWIDDRGEGARSDVGTSETRAIRFNVRLDLHTVKLAPRPPRPARRSVQEHRRSAKSVVSDHSSEHGTSRTSMNPERNNVSLQGSYSLTQVTSPISTRSIGSTSAYSIDSDNAAGSHFDTISSNRGAQRPISDDPISPKTNAWSPSSPIRNRGKSFGSLSREARRLEEGAHPKRNVPGHVHDDHVQSLAAEGPDVSSADHFATSPTDSEGRKGSMSSLARKGSQRRPSMISKLLDFGGLRKKSFTDRSDSGGLSMSAADESAPTRRPSLLSPADEGGSSSAGLQRNLSSMGTHRREASNDEALDIGDDDDEDDQGNRITRPSGMLSSGFRRRSSASSTGRTSQPLNSISMEPDLGPVEEHGAFEVHRVTSRSSAGFDSSSAAADDETESSSAWGLRDDLSVSETREAWSVQDGKDFVSLLRAASELSLSVAREKIKNAAGEATPEGPATPSATNMKEPEFPNLSQRAQGKRPETGTANSSTTNTPQVRPVNASIPSTPSRSVKSLDLDRGSSARDSLEGRPRRNPTSKEDDEAWWPCGEVDPLPVSVAIALGQALGWEGIMQLCYGRGSPAAREGTYAPLGKAAALEEASKQHEKSVLSWRTNVASAEIPSSKEGNSELAPVPGQIDLGLGDGIAGVTASLEDKLGLEPGPTEEGVAETDGPSKLERLLKRAPTRNQTVPGIDPGTDHLGAPEIEDSASQKGASRRSDLESTSPSQKPTLSDLLSRKVWHGRSWTDWIKLAASIKGWVDEYETTRVQSGLAREIGFDPVPTDPNVDPSMQSSTDTSEDGSGLGASTLHQQLQVPIPGPDVISPISSPVMGLRALSPSSGTMGPNSSVRGSREIPRCVLFDATNRRNGFRRRVGIPEGLPAGPDGVEFADYSWSRQKLGVKHFATAMTIGTDSLSNYMNQLGNSAWVHRSAWELDYLEMCVFKTPLVADRFPPPGEQIVPAARSYRPPEGAIDRTKLCPNPDEDGCWSAVVWKEWLSTIKEGEIIVPAVGWQAWWTLISVLNGADRTGRTYDLQVKTLEEPFEALTDLSAVYI